MTNSLYDSLVYMGEITKPHGIKGELSFFTEAESLDILIGDAFLQPPHQETMAPLKIEVKKIRRHHGSMLITLSGVENRNEAEQFRNFSLFITREKFPLIEDNDHYIIDLIGANIFVLSGSCTEEQIGVLKSIDTPAGQELWEIQTPDGKELLFPAVQEFIKDIDIKNNKIVITPPPGLFELY